jgi:hypothetical protein
MDETGAVELALQAGQDAGARLDEQHGRSEGARHGTAQTPV